MKFGLIGYPLSHSFSKTYFTEKFRHDGLVNFSYELLPLMGESAIQEILRRDFFGLNVTIPYKTAIINYLNDIDQVALKIGAVNTIVRIGKNSWKGFNTDVLGFRESLVNWYAGNRFPTHALVLGSGGSSKAVCSVLHQLGIDASIVSRGGKDHYTYQDLSREIIQKHLLIINATPIGMMPDDLLFPAIPYEYITSKHRVFDLIYNPANTLFLRLSEEKGAMTKNGLDMLYKQADHAWSIWKNYGKF